MDSNLISISKIFTEKLLRIPDYQRGYAWTKKETSEFWNDLAYLENDKNHYVGVLTLEDVPDENIALWIEDHWIIRSKSYHPSYIVDGQQRITTIVILIQCIIEEIKSRGDNIELNYTDISDIRKKYIFEEKSKTSCRSYIFGYDKDNPSYEFLKRKIFMEDSVNSVNIENTIYTQNLSSAKNFFIDKLKSMSVEEIEVTYKKVTQHLLFNIYSLDEEIDTYVAFETMNNRGKPLSHLELLKNRLIYLTTKIDEDDEHKSSLRHSINECWKAMYHFLGRDMSKRLDDDTFLYHHSTVFFKDLLAADANTDLEDSPRAQIFGIDLSKEEYHDFRNFDHVYYHTNNKSMLLDDIFSAKPINDETRHHVISIDAINGYVKNLKKSVEIWYYIHNPSQSNFDVEISEWILKIIKLTGWQSTRIILLEVLSNHYNEKNDVIFFLKNLERLMFIHTMLYRFHMIESSTFIPLALHLKRSKNLKDCSAKIKTQADLLIKNDYVGFKQNFKDGDFYNWPGIKYFLYQYEYKLKSEVRSERSKLSWDEFHKSENDKDFKTIEHIYPQKPNRTYWAELYKGLSIKQKKQLRNTLGNLVALSHGKNASLSNKPFPEKKKDYKNGCYSEIALTEYDNWGKIEIQKRSVELMYFMDMHWELGFCPQGIIKDKSKREAFYLDFLNLNF